MLRKGRRGNLAKCQMRAVRLHADGHLPSRRVRSVSLRRSKARAQLIRWPRSDFDVVVQDDRLRYHSTYSVLSTLKTAVVKCQFAQQHEVRLITGAKVPIVKLKTSNQFGRFDMDVSFNSDKGPEGARESLRLRKEVEMRRRGNAERVKRLALLLKTLLLTYDLNEVRDGGIGGLTVFCMALSHVQVRAHTSTTLSRTKTPLTLSFVAGQRPAQLGSWP